ncbi:hypothetical protein BU23DRAFT_630829 [Bimuria novae-zelandiae CBS 107.79]|uniref:Uncharacterized protein n=1 Tax=Bimuria novae-zelandiae CBS 107.79 TaxID=1447943 RepID=A0A6A5UHA6_9PLEO|nr:hypothetical protein BU23DRAFT_630829 [Bimuria novae-zelandiae CBS 107.79]
MKRDRGAQVVIHNGMVWMLACPPPVGYRTLAAWNKAPFNEPVRFELHARCCKLIPMASFGWTAMCRLLDINSKVKRLWASSRLALCALLHPYHLVDMDCAVASEAGGSSPRKAHERPADALPPAIPSWPAASQLGAAGTNWSRSVAGGHAEVQPASKHRAPKLAAEPHCTRASAIQNHLFATSHHRKDPSRSTTPPQPHCWYRSQRIRVRFSQQLSRLPLDNSSLHCAIVSERSCGNMLSLISNGPQITL